MDVAELSQILSESLSAGTNVFLRFEPQVLDFTNPELKPALLIWGSGGNRGVIDLAPDNLTFVTSLLQVALSDAKVKLVAWGIKDFLSFYRHRTGKLLQIDATLVDLKILESYAGIKREPPGSLSEALGRIKELVKGGFWDELWPIYKKIHLPLLSVVLPTLETNPILDIVDEERKFAHYEIDGQANGRLRCESVLDHGVRPHNLDEQAKARLRPASLDDTFLSFDYKNMEVSVLAHLSKDEKLSELLESPGVYSTVWNWVTGEPGDREKGKKLFLPVIYGQQPLSLSKRLGVELPIAEQFIGRLHDLFPAAWTYVTDHVQQAKTSGYAKDIFGKRRHFSEDECYKARDFSVQSPGAILCLEKLIALHQAGICTVLFIHDEYVVTCPKKLWKETYLAVQKILSTESPLFPGMKLRVACHGGRELNDLKSIGKK